METLKQIKTLLEARSKKTKLVHGRISEEMFNTLRDYMNLHHLTWNEVIEASLTSLIQEIKD